MGDEDNDLVLTVNENSDENEIVEENQNVVKPTRSRIRGFTKPGNTFTPVIRPRTSVKPTLIATPASSAPQPTPTFGSSSPGFLASSSLFANRGQSRFSSSQAPSFGSA